MPEDERAIRAVGIAKIEETARAYRASELLLRERKLLTFGSQIMDVVVHLRANESLRESLRARYRYILVDEFQDTSSAQLELVRLLTAGWQQDDGRSIFCVGDPMQSIYGFRQAEVRAFLELAEEGVGDVQFTVERLRSNFRSAAPLVQWINHCFERVMPQVDDRRRGAIAFRASVPAVTPFERSECGVECAGFTTRAAESNAVADMIGAETLRHPKWRIAVLVRAKNHAREIAASLRAIEDFSSRISWRWATNSRIIRCVMSCGEGIAVPGGVKKARNCSRSFW